MSNTPADYSSGPLSPPAGSGPSDPIVLLAADATLHARLLATGLVPGLRPAASLTEFKDLLATLRPRIVFVAAMDKDESLPDLISRLQPRLTRRRFVVLGEDDDSETVVSCLHAGADDFISLRPPARLPSRLARVLAHLPGVGSRRPMDARFKTLADSAPALVWITDDTGDFIHFNRSWLDFTGRALEAELRQGWTENLLPEDRVRFAKGFIDCFLDREVFRFDFRLRRHDGHYRWVTCQAVPHHEDNGVFTGYIGSCLDVSDQHEAETLLALRAITQAALAGFGRFALGPHSVAEIKQEATRLVCDTLRLDYSELLLVDTLDADNILPAFSTGLPPGFVHSAMSAVDACASGHSHLRLDDDATIFPGRENHAALGVRSALAAPIYIGDKISGFLTGLSTEPRVFGREAFEVIQGLVTTISTVHQRALAESALQESEFKLLQSQKMESVGQLAGGVAHDFNNLLTAVRCYGDMLHDELTTIAPDLKTKTAEILKAAARASSLTRQLLAFSRKQVLQPEVLDMNTVIEDLRDLVRSLLSEYISLDITLAETDACFMADRNQIDQVVLNLCINARDAMPQGGRLTLSIALTEIHEPDSQGLPPGSYVRLTIGDNGIGMDADVQAHLFQPFFTTKPVGRGTGLGLATCAVIVKNCNGGITFESRPGQGTSFSILFPRIDAPYANFFEEQEEQIVTGQERILVVEDDEAIRQVSFAILDSHGYRVTVVPGGSEALSLFRLDPPPVFDLLLTDVIMPEMNGLELARRIHDHHIPDLRTLFMSGYLGNTETVRAVADYNLPFLEKPFTLVGLARKVRETLDAPPTELPPSPK